MKTLDSVDQLLKTGYVLKDEKAVVLTNNIEKHLKDKDMSYADLAKKTGVSRQMISMIIHQQIRPGADVALKFEEVLEVPVQELFNLTDEAWLTIATVGYDSPAYLWMPDLTIVDNKERKNRIKECGGEYRHLKTGEIVTKKEYESRLQEFQKDNKEERMETIRTENKDRSLSRNELLSMATDELEEEFLMDYEILYRQIMIPIRP